MKNILFNFECFTDSWQDVFLVLQKLDRHEEIENVTFGIPVFHCYGHVGSCQVRSRSSFACISTEIFNYSSLSRFLDRNHRTSETQ